MPFRHLGDDRIFELVDALVNAKLATPDTRRILLAGVNPVYSADLPVIGSPRAQLLADASELDQLRRLADGSVPMAAWLRAGVFLTDAREEGKVFRAALSDVQSKTAARSGPDVTAAGSNGHIADPIKLPESKERIVHQNDIVPFGFLAQGHAAGASVARLQVRRYKEGQRLMTSGNPVIYLGTGWLIGARLLVTNHHVINARDDLEPPASDAELSVQGANTVVQFDYDGTNAAGTIFPVRELVCSDATLDYAILRLDADPGRPALRLDSSAIDVTGSTYLPVNIIQHPNGEPKQLAMRNNLVTASSATDLRYFTDTMPGSSGSPVFDDRWRAIALHRGSTSVDGVQFQGRDTAWVNVGTPVSAILAHLEQHAPEVRAEIGV